ncbi:MAG: acyl carrier protein [Candidatus Thorarchaeota archaeon]|jgi:acyl carrier protein
MKLKIMYRLADDSGKVTDWKTYVGFDKLNCTMLKFVDCYDDGVYGLMEKLENEEPDLHLESIVITKDELPKGLIKEEPKTPHWQIMPFGGEQRSVGYFSTGHGLSWAESSKRIDEAVMESLLEWEIYEFHPVVGLEGCIAETHPDLKDTNPKDIILEDLGIDSLDMVEIIMTVEDKLQRTINDDNMFEESRTLKDLQDKIKDYLLNPKKK